MEVTNGSVFDGTIPFAGYNVMNKLLVCVETLGVSVRDSSVRRINSVLLCRFMSRGSLSLSTTFHPSAALV